ncbi:fibronectin type III domain-containing protein [Modestobacter sp. SSW1-42]|uniref:fibronectin type III domain-containing protein n=1 Tax=Modestobacter sp. SSW1-42 TaxID=596372 RepID=UPI00398806EE
MAAVLTAGTLLSGSGGPPSAPGLQATSYTNPTPPSNVTTTPADRSLLVSWTASTEPGVVGYRVWVDGVPGPTTTTTSATVTGLVNGRSYVITVRAGTLVAGTATEGTTASAPVTGVPADSVAPARPARPTAVRGDGQVTLSWTAGTEYDVDGYRVLRDGVPVSGLLAGQGTTGWTDTGLQNDRPYGYALQVHDTSGNWSPASAPDVPATPTDLTPPGAPTGLSALAGDRQVELSWAPPAETDVVAHRVLRDGVEVAVVRGATSSVDTGLVDGRTYGYALVAEDGHGNLSPRSAAVTATPRDTTPPAVPPTPTATPRDGAVELSWPADPDAAAYRVLRDGVAVATVTGTAHRDEGLTNGTPYRYALVAVDAAGNPSAATPEVLATPTDQTPPAAPTGVTAAPGDGTASLSWTADPDAAAYRVLRDDVVLATVTAPATQAVVRGLTNGAPTTLTVVAVDAAGNASAPSAAVTVVPVARRVPVQGAGESGGLAVSGDGRFVVVGTRAPLEPADTNTAHELYLLDRTAGTARRIAPLPAGATGASDPTNAGAPAVSDDGRYVALATTAALVPEDTNRVADVYRLDTTTGRWTPVSVPAGGRVSAVAGTVLQTGPSVYATSPSVAMSADGDVVVFYSARADLVARDTNGVVDVFAKTMSTGAVTRVSATATGTDLPRTALGPALALTPDGRYALFPATSASGPVVLYRKTLSGAGAGTATVVSAVTVAGRTTEFPAYRDAGDIDLSDDGRYVALVTTAKLGTTTPSASWTTGLAYRVDAATGTALALGDGQTATWEHQVALDPTGRFGFFGTAAAEVSGDANGHTDHLRRDLDGGVRGPLVLVTADAAGRAAPGPTGAITPAEYGRAVPVTGDLVLVTTSNALQPTDTNGVRDLYSKDLAGGAVQAPVG